MKFLKKWGILIVTFLFLAVIAVLLYLGYQAKLEYENTITQQEGSIYSMSNFIDNEIGPLVNCYVLNRAVHVGDRIEDDMLAEASIPEKIAYTNKEIQVEVTDENGKTHMETQYERTVNVILNKNEIIGKKFRVNLDEGAIILSDFVIDEPVNNSDRFYQIILEDYPTDVNVGDYVDIRIQLTYGQDFIAIPHKRIERLDLGNGLFTFIFNENEINIYDSMLLDSAMYPAVKIYALKYIDTTQQVAAEAYYPLNNNIQELLAINPNILELVREEIKLERDQLNALMGGDIESFDERALENVQRAINEYRTNLNRDISSAIRERIRAEEDAARAAARG